MIKALIFDMDGLMLDTERVKLKYRNIARMDLGLNYIKDLISETLGKTLTESRRIYIDKYGKDYPFEEIYKRSKVLWQEHINKYGVPIKEGLLDLLYFIKENNYKIGVATSTYEDQAKYLLKTADIIHYFDIIVSGNQVTYSKPHPDIYLKTAKLLSIHPEECLVLEDSPSGVSSAFKAGMKVVMVPDLIEPSDELKGMVNKVIDRLDEVIPILKNELI